MPARIATIDALIPVLSASTSERTRDRKRITVLTVSTERIYWPTFTSTLAQSIPMSADFSVSYKLT